MPSSKEMGMEDKRNKPRKIGNQPYFIQWHFLLSIYKCLISFEEKRAKDTQSSYPFSQLIYLPLSTNTFAIAGYFPFEFFYSEKKPFSGHSDRMLPMQLHLYIFENNEGSAGNSTYMRFHRRQQMEARNDGVKCHRNWRMIKLDSSGQQC